MRFWRFAHGLCGSNGAGKSSLLEAITRTLNRRGAESAEKKQEILRVTLKGLVLEIFDAIAAILVLG
ncbi:hypothetical protein [Nostoc sp.]|uniref:hypothetical protein n=1 Tax=Nostoc sp. TaxID=1180 RepID=UPI002FF6D41B